MEKSLTRISGMPPPLFSESWPMWNRLPPVCHSLMKRFSPIEVENGYAVWDNIRDEIYVDDEGVSEEFTSRWQAEEYARQLNQLKTLARYYGEGETILIRQYPNGQYYVQYCYDDQDNTVYATAGGFDTFEQAEAALYTHRPQAKREPHRRPGPRVPAGRGILVRRRASCDLSGTERTFCNQYGFISGRVTPTTGSFPHWRRRRNSFTRTALWPKRSRHRRNRPPMPRRTGTKRSAGIRWWSITTWKTAWTRSWNTRRRRKRNRRHRGLSGRHDGTRRLCL